MEPKEPISTIRLYYCQRLKASISILTCKNNRGKPEISPFTSEINRPLRPSACGNCTDWLQWEKQSPVAEIPVVTEKVPFSVKTVDFPSFTSIKDSEFSVNSSLKPLNFESAFDTTIGSITDDILNDIDFSKISSKGENEEGFEGEMSLNDSKEKTKGKYKKSNKGFQEQSLFQPEKKKRGRKSKVEKEQILRLEKISHLLFSLENILLLKRENNEKKSFDHSSFVCKEYLSTETLNILEPLDNLMNPLIIEDTTVPFDIFNNTFNEQPLPKIEKKIEETMKVESNLTTAMNKELALFVQEPFMEQAEQAENNSPETSSSDCLKILVHADPLNALELKEYLIQRYPLAEIVCPLIDFNFQNGLAEKQFQSVIETLETSWATHVIDIHFVEMDFSLDRKKGPKKISFYIPEKTILNF